MNKVVILDYGIGNLKSVLRACEIVNMHVHVTNNKNDILDADGLILPGVGAFGSAMENLRQYELVEPIIAFSKTGKPMMGICLGMQLLLDSSEESPNVAGLGIISGTCLKFKQSENEDLKVPQIQWNRITPPRNNAFDHDSPLTNVVSGAYMYFVHSYFAFVNKTDNVLSTTSYGQFDYASSIRKGNVFGFQFHPEKSGPTGLKIYKSFSDLIAK